MALSRDEIAARYRARHKEALRARAKKYYWDNHDQCIARNNQRAEYFKTWRDANLEERKAYEQAYRDSHKEQIHDNFVSRYAEKRHEYIERAEDRQRELSKRGKYTQADVELLYSRQNGRCAGCVLRLQNSRDRRVKNHYEVDHVMPVSLGGSNTPDNLQLLCVKCNRTKHAAHPDVWAARLGRLFV